MADIRSGHCLCGAIAFEVTDPAHELGACHCSMCRRWTGLATLSLGVPADALKILSGKEEIRAYRSSDWAERAFCDTCGSPLWYRLTAGGDAAEYYLAAGLLDDLSGMRLEHEIYIDRKPDAYAFAGPTHQMTEAEFLASLPPNPEE